MSDRTEDYGQSVLLGACKVCSGRIGYIDCPTGGWWAHEVHPEDDHDAVGPDLGDDRG